MKIDFSPIVGDDSLIDVDDGFEDYEVLGIGAPGVSLTLPTPSDERYAAIRAKRLRRKAIADEARTLAFSMRTVEDALRENRGNCSQVAKLLGTKAEVIRRYIRNYPHLQRVMKSIKEEILDLAEQKLIEQVEEGNMTAITLVLRTQGKERGYTEKNTLEHELGEGMAKNSAALIEAMRKGAKETKLIEATEWEVVEVKSEESPHSPTS